MALLYKSDPARGAEWARLFAERAPDVPFRIWPDLGDPREVKYLVAWQPPADLTTLLPSLEALFSMGAGVDHIDLSAVPAHVPVVRMIEPGIVDGIVEYAAMSVLALHRDLPAFIAQQRARRWQWRPARRAAIRPPRRQASASISKTWPWWRNCTRPISAI